MNTLPEPRVETPGKLGNSHINILEELLSSPLELTPSEKASDVIGLLWRPQFCHVHWSLLLLQLCGIDLMPVSQEDEDRWELEYLEVARSVTPQGVGIEANQGHLLKSTVRLATPPQDAITRFVLTHWIRWFVPGPCQKF
jgi:hypothetical protein